MGSIEYPGVYVEEVASGVRPIAGVSTSIAGFVDWFPRGPLAGATRISSLPEFEREFGGLHHASEASYAVQQYYLNGGQLAWVVRVAAPDAAAASIHLTDGAATPSNLFSVRAVTPGEWGNGLEVAVDHEGVTAPAFNLTVRDVHSGGPEQVVRDSETFVDLTTDRAGPRFVETVVNRESRLVRVTATGDGGRLAATAGDRASGGSDGTLPGTDDWHRSAGAAALLGGLRELERIAPSLLNVLCLPAAATLDADSTKAVLAAATSLCERRRAFLLVDVEPTVESVADMVGWMSGDARPRTANAAVYFPRLLVPDPLQGDDLRPVGPSGTIAGLFARTDASLGVWKAPAGMDAKLRNVTLPLRLSDRENGVLNPLGVNALRDFPTSGPVAWGARTLEGADERASEWKYIPVRRLALFIEESLHRGLQWVVFEPNDEPLWAQIRLDVGAFMHDLFRRGAFAATTPHMAYLVRCDRTTMSQADLDQGLVTVLVGFAPLKPAEFVTIEVQLLTGQLPAAVTPLLREIVAVVRDRATTSGGGPGITALFVGPPGSNKGLAAKFMAGELGADLYRVDLSQVVSKYIGETEKNLRRVFDAAEQGGALLYFDEADDLFGERPEERASSLLRSMEQYRGLAILATDSGRPLDPAFIRRFRFLVNFPGPDEVSAGEA